METSEILFNKMKEFEGCRLQAYQDAAGVWTIGYGHTMPGLVKRCEWESIRFFE